VYEQLLVTGGCGDRGLLTGRIETIFKWFPEKLNLGVDGKQEKRMYRSAEIQ
jgi:hypothetical protein